MRFNYSSLPKDFTITHHAGSLGKKENSIESIENSVKFGAQVVEFDVSFRKNGTVVIIHKDEPEDNEGTDFEDAICIVSKSPNCKINLDIKSTLNLPEIDRIVEKYGISDRVFYTGVMEKWIDCVKLNSKIPYYLNWNISEEEAADDTKIYEIADKAVSFGAIGINSNFKNVTPNITEIFRKKGLLVSYWTAHSEDEIIKILDTSPDNMTTIIPDVAEKICEAKYSKK